MERRVIFKDTSAQTEIIMPVTPSFSVVDGVKMEIVNINEVGDVAMAGLPSASQLALELLLPARFYPFCAATPEEPYSYVRRFTAWARAGTPLRYVVSGTTVNVPVLIESVTYGERDGSGDVYATVEMRVHKPLETVTTQATPSATSPVRADEELQTAEMNYTVKAGDTLSAICRQYYGDATLCYKLASYNGIKNANLIWVGQNIRIPPASALAAVSVTCSYTKPDGTVYSYLEVKKATK